MKQLIGITSPPYEEAVTRIRKSGANDLLKDKWFVNEDNQAGYSTNNNNIGNLKSKHNQELDFDITKYNKCGGELYWYGCYDSEIYYKQFVTPESYAHPAKISFLLTERIFKHLEHLGLLKEGMTICDFMAGSFRIPLLASLRGYDAVGVELEPHFRKMGEDNKKFAENKIGRNLNFEIIQGDSRQLSKILNKGDVGITSPPFSDMSRPDRKLDETRLKNNRFRIADNYSRKEMVGVVSPLYQDAIVNFEDDEGKKRAERLREAGFDRKNSGMLRSIETKSNVNAYKGFSKGYSQNPQNIGNLKDRELVGITSPPYSHDSVVSITNKSDLVKEKFNNIPYSDETIDYESRRNIVTGRFDSANFENIGRLKDSERIEGQQSYLSAMLQVYQEAYKSGMQVICTITKNPTRAGKLRRLDLDTSKLIEMSGFKIIDYHRAILFKTFEQQTLIGSTKKEYKGRLSFFKRLSLQKGNKASEWEDIIIGIKN